MCTVYLIKLAFLLPFTCILALVKISLNLMSQISLLPFLFPVYIFPNQLHQPFFGLNEAQLEALYQEQVLKLDLANPDVMLIFLQSPICYLFMRLL